MPGDRMPRGRHRADRGPVAGTIGELIRGSRSADTFRRRAAVGLAAAALVAVPQADSAAFVGSTSPASSAAPRAVAADVVRSTGSASVTAQESALQPGAPAGSDATPGPAPQAGATGAVSALAAGGIPSAALEAYTHAAAASPAACHLAWPLVAAIGRVESNHGRFAGAVLHADGRSTPPIIGIALDGDGTALIRDTDGGRLDGDPVHDRAVGPTQFIPSTWRIYASDGDGDGRSDPFDIHDAAAATAKYLCAAGGDLSSVGGQMRAVLAYNHSASYVATVLTLAASYAGTPLPPLPSPSAEPPSTVPPANPAPPPAIDVDLPPATAVAPPSAAPSSSASPSSAAPSSSAPASSAAPSSSPTPTAAPTTGCSNGSVPGVPATVDIANGAGDPAAATGLASRLAAAGIRVG
ncbi:MAG: hypothetical protein JWQ26_3735, partial [Modestobacter sp.]|nr:hypothetical protein [Modestobacter sp.]